MKDDVSQLKFGAAMQELEGILGRVESEEIDIDELAEELKRAAQLLEVCRTKIRRAEVEVSQVVQSLEEPAVESAPDAEPAPAAESETDAEPDGEPKIAGTASLFEHDG